MFIQQLDELNSATLDKDEIMNYLSQVVLSKTDEEISRKHLQLEQSKKSLTKVKEQLNRVKNTSTEVSKEYAKEKQLTRILSLIAALKKEGAIRGNLRVKIIKLLNNVHKMDFYELRNIEQEYSIHLPNKYKSTI